MKLRPALERAFEEFASESGVVIGAPGVGKSHLLRGFAKRWSADSSTCCVFIPVDRAPFESDTDLRAELGVRGDIVQVFASMQPEAARHVLLIDALDAARSDRARAFFISLARRVVESLPT